MGGVRVIVVDRRFHGWASVKPMGKLMAFGAAGIASMWLLMVSAEPGVGRSEAWMSVAGPYVIVASSLLVLSALLAALAALGVIPLTVGVVTSKHVFFGGGVEFALRMAFRAPREEPGTVEVDFRRLPMAPPNERFVQAWRYRKPGQPWRGTGAWKEPTPGESHVLTARLESLGFTVVDVTPAGN